MQIDLFDHPRAHANDPITSYMAAARAESSGQIRTDARVCLEAVQRFPGSTSRELASASGLDRHAVARRLPELERAERIRKGPKRKCRIAGTLAVTWEIIRCSPLQP